MGRKLLIIQAAGLGADLLDRCGRSSWDGLSFRDTDGVFPAVTCTAQASFRTAAPPADHGMIANGLYCRRLRRAAFWEQSSALVDGERIWRRFRDAGRRVAMLFWQQSLGDDVDVVLSPAPIHKHHGGMIEDCYARPAGLYAALRRELGRPLRLRQYWGPLATAKVGDWIADATAAVIADDKLACDLVLTYLPTLDYDLQRHGLDDRRTRRAVDRLFTQLDTLRAAAERCGFDVLVFGDYAMGLVDGAAFPNRALRRAGLMKVREVKGMLYPDLHASRAFAMVDHEIAHVYVPDAGDMPAARDALSATDGVGEVLDRDGQLRVGLDHPNSGELVVVAAERRWLAYPWWTHARERPDYASHVDIHNKPGYDPCELFFAGPAWPPLGTSQDTTRIRASHGRTGPGRRIAWTATFDLPDRPGSLIALADGVRRFLDEA